MCVVMKLVILRLRVSAGGLYFPEMERRSDLTFCFVPVIPEIHSHKP